MIEVAATVPASGRSLEDRQTSGESMMAGGQVRRGKESLKGTFRRCIGVRRCFSAGSSVLLSCICVRHSPSARLELLKDAHVGYSGCVPGLNIFIPCCQTYDNYVSL